MHPVILAQLVGYYILYAEHMAYHRLFFLVWSDQFKSMDLPESLLTCLLHIKVIK
ncbi:hypothetical protein MTR_8g036910 [Medicago truncatula]|uniref:Uncharacterized protein n=1 Tax=Medicago truncatula TaxID=3880 RepID=G7LEF8_MEDTR|nr:hypothetical protein MTR_8g036910 [Medicago truncatula]